MTPTSPAHAVPALSLDEVTLLLGLPLEQTSRLASGEPFDGPAGLRCCLQIDMQEHAAASARPIVLLGIRSHALAGAAVQRLLEMQALLLAQGPWYLGASSAGELQVMPLESFCAARDVVAVLDVANLVAWAVLRGLSAGESETASPVRVAAP
jgi:hypothetical protein